LRLRNIILLLMLVVNPNPCNIANAENLSIFGETTSGMKRLADESAELVTTPFKIETGNILITLGVVGATSLTYVFDHDMQQKLQSHKSSGWTKATDAGALAGNPIIHLGLAALVYGAGIAGDSPKWKETGEMMGEALILADASTFILKETVGRGRPTTTNSKGNFKPFGFRNDYDSFPSMHTSSSFALASVLASTSDNILTKMSYYAAATFVGFSRMYQNKHWASDIVFGAALGELCGRVVTGYHASGSKFTLAPQVYDGGAGVALVGKW